MKKAILISIFCTVILTSCGKFSEPAESVETSAVSKTTAVTTSVSTSAEVKKDTKTVSKISQLAETSRATTTAKSSSASEISAVSTQKSATATQQVTQEIYYPTEQNESEPKVTTTQKSLATTASAPQTTTARQVTTTPKSTTTKATTTKQKNTIQWTDTMKAWRKLCEGKSVSGSEWELVRQDIVNYGVEKFNGKTTVELNCGIDFYTRMFQSPLNLTVNTSLKGMSRAHLDAYAEPECVAMINYAVSEEEIYEIVEQTRADCLTVIDNGLESWYEFCDTNDCLEYASNLEFNVGLDGTAIWFLTE